MKIIRKKDAKEKSSQAFDICGHFVLPVENLWLYKIWQLRWRLKLKENTQRIPISIS